MSAIERGLHDEVGELLALATRSNSWAETLSLDPPSGLGLSVLLGFENDLLSVHELRAPASDVNGVWRGA